MEGKDMASSVVEVLSEPAENQESMEAKVEVEQEGEGFRRYKTKYRFWFALVATLVSLWDVYQGGSFLFHYTSYISLANDVFGLMPFWKSVIDLNLFFQLEYVLHIVFWFILGWVMDNQVKMQKDYQEEHKKWYVKNFRMVCSVALIGILAFVGFYMFENSEQRLSQVMKNHSQYSDQKVQYVIDKLTQQGKVGQYKEHLKGILTSTKSAGVYSVAMNAIGTIGGKDSVKVIMQNFGKFEDPYTGVYALQQNEKGILELLNMKNSKDELGLGIQAAGIVKSQAFLPALQTILDKSDDPMIGFPAQQLIEEIKKGKEKKK